MEACRNFLNRALILLLSAASLSACVAIREVTLTPQITGTHEAFEIDEHASCPLWYAPSARGPIGLTSHRGRDTAISTSSDFLLLDAFRNGTQRIDVTRIVRPQLTGVNRGIVISPVPGMTFRREFEEGDETDCVVLLGNPRLTVKVLVPNPD